MPSSPAPRRAPPMHRVVSVGQYDESYASSGDVQVVTGLERRRRWTEEQKAAIVSESMAPGATVLEVARKYDLHPRAIFRWKAKLVAENETRPPLALPAPGPKKRGRKPKATTPTAPAVVPPPKIFAVEPAPPPAAAAPDGGVRLVIGDLVITIATAHPR